MKSVFRIAFPVLCLALSAALPACSATIYQATLAASNEAPPTASSGSGSALLTLSDDQSTLTVNILFTGLTGPAAAAHIHCCSAPGTNSAVALPFTNFPGMTAGTYTNTFTLSSPGVLINGVTAAQLIAGLNAGTTYVNLHTSMYPSGEIRGFVTATPEPGTAWLGVVALAGLAGMRHVRRMRVGQ